MEIKRVGSQPSVKGPAGWFTGTVRVDPLFQAPEPALVSDAKVGFEPDRLAYPSAWADSHCHRGVRQALARCDAHHRHDAHRDSGKEGRQSCRLDGTRQQRAVSARLSAH
jgi:hypothetical protein